MSCSARPMIASCAVCSICGAGYSMRSQFSAWAGCGMQGQSKTHRPDYRAPWSESGLWGIYLEPPTVDRPELSLKLLVLILTVSLAMAAEALVQVAQPCSGCLLKKG